MKKLLLSTASVAATSVPVFAQDAGNLFRQEADPTEIHASDFIGMRVYRTDTVDAESYEGVQEGWDDIGEINDVILSRDGNVEAVLVDIGGFLGIGENQVAVDMDSIQFVSDAGTPDEESDFFLVLNAPRDAFEEAPTYSFTHDRDMAAADANADANTDMTRDHAADAEGTDLAENETDMAATTEENATNPVTPDVDATDNQMANDGTGLARDGYVTAMETDLEADDLTGASAYDVNDKRIGEVSELLLADDGKITAAIVDVGGFLGIGEKPVQLELSKLDILRSEDGGDVRVYISMSEEELESLPEYEK